MTIFGPDLSNYQAGLTLQPNTVFVFAKSSEGTGYRDTAYANFKAQAAAQGAVFSGYHFLYHGNIAAQVQLALSAAGGSPIFLDVEPTGTQRPTVQDVMQFTQQYRSAGGHVWAMYLPYWYWVQLGRPDLTQAGLPLISSNYTTYSDTGPGWAPYGGVTPLLWQYTDSFPYNGKLVDFNAFKGTVQTLAAIVAQTAPAPAPQPGPFPEDEDMPQQIENTTDHPHGYVYAFPKGKYKEVAFVADTFGDPAGKLRVVVWTPTGPMVYDQTSVPTGSTVLAFSNPAAAYAVTVSREDSGSFPVGVAFA